MRKLYFLIILSLILAIFLSGCSWETPEILSADFVITKWEQEYLEYAGEWSDKLWVYYSIENTGNVEIDYYQVYFEATYADGSKFEKWTNGTFIDVGHIENDYMIFLVLRKQIVSVEVSEYELES